MKCPYCDFNIHVTRSWPEEEYTEALIAELKHYAALDVWRGHEVQSIYFGGGTPSLFASASIGRIIDAVARLWPVREERQKAKVQSLEITLEANPGTVTLASLRELRSAGVNRISFGVQSFEPRHLARLGRDHGREEALASVELARSAGFENVSLDLIFAVPDQTLEEWETDLRTAFALVPDHISAYNLTYEERTAFYVWRARGRLTPVDEDTEAAMFIRAEEILEGAGYSQYEVSNYARSGYESQHNLNYWRGGDYLGVGAGAHSFTSAAAPGRRWHNERNHRRYIDRVRADGHSRVYEEQLSASQARGEFVFLGLRYRDGIRTDDFACRFGVDFTTAFPHVSDLEQNGLLEVRDGRCRLTRRGLQVADSVFATFV
jgi:oxygen-independent coproporphyrinogen-3 oxidase